MTNYYPALFGENLFNAFDDFDRNFFRGFPDINHELYGNHQSHMMKTDVRETDDGYELLVDLPGFKKDEINLDLSNGYLSISTEKTLDKEDRNEQGRVLRHERYNGMMKRSFYVGEGLTEEDIKAQFQDGVLKLKLPKPENRVETKKRIMIEG